MRFWNGLGAWIINVIEKRAERKRQEIPGPMGDFYKQGGNALLYENLPLCQDDLVLDAGGYQGEWTAGIITRYGCRSKIFEPVPNFAEHCRRFYEHNGRVCVHEVALGGTNRVASFSLADNGTSEFINDLTATCFKVKVISIIAFLEMLNLNKQQKIGVLKLNIEGGEYEVLETLLETGAISQFRCLLIQYHRQPIGWEKRYENSIEWLKKTHSIVWHYPMVWGRWELREC